MLISYPLTDFNNILIKMGHISTYILQISVWFVSDTSKIEKTYLESAYRAKIKKYNILIIKINQLRINVI